MHWYEIRLQGHLDQQWSAWFDGLSISHEPDGNTVLRGPIADEAALHGVLTRVRDTGPGHAAPGGEQSRCWRRARWAACIAHRSEQRIIAIQETLRRTSGTGF
jgi:hypothetical protein